MCDNTQCDNTHLDLKSPDDLVSHLPHHPPLDGMKTAVGISEIRDIEKPSLLCFAAVIPTGISQKSAVRLQAQQYLHRVGVDKRREKV